MLMSALESWWAIRQDLRSSFLPTVPILIFIIIGKLIDSLSVGPDSARAIPQDQASSALNQRLLVQKQSSVENRYSYLPVANCMCTEWQQE